MHVAIFVCLLHGMKPKDVEDNLNHKLLLYLITDYMFVAALHFMLDMVDACAGMLQTIHLQRRCVALENLTIDRCMETLYRAEQ